jgi:hypothetical protein
MVIYLFMQGGKSIHLFNLIKREQPDKKAKTSEKWWQSEMCYGNEIAEGCEDILRKGVATLKIDGSNGFVFEFPDEVTIQITSSHPPSRILAKPNSFSTVDKTQNSPKKAKPNTKTTNH